MNELDGLERIDLTPDDVIDIGVIGGVGHAKAPRGKVLPVYLVLDTSGSMHGDSISAVADGVTRLLSGLRNDPYISAFAAMSIITFASEARQVCQLESVSTFRVPKLKTGGFTSLGAALELLHECISREVNGRDWLPLVFVMTDGEPTDDVHAGIEKIKELSLGRLVAFGIGAEANTEVLRLLSDEVISMEGADQSTIRGLFDLIDSSVHESVSDVPHTEGLADLPDVISVIPDTRKTADSAPAERKGRSSS